MRVALAQLAAGLDKAANREAVREAVAATASQEPDLVVLPEAVMCDFGAPDMPLAPVAEPLDGPFVDLLKGLASTYETTLVAGMFEATDDRPYNTLVAVDSDGIRAAYRKAHLYDSFGYHESDRLSAGPVEPATLEVGELRIGLMTCYDLRFPELSRLLVDAGAEVLVVPAAWLRGPHKEDHWRTLLRARAIENTVYVAAAGQPGKAYVGHSMLVDPFGVVVAALGEQEGITGGDVDAKRLHQVREVNPALHHRRLRVTPNDHAEQPSGA
jgi:deaminated glutathione amidase